MDLNILRSGLTLVVAAVFILYGASKLLDPLQLFEYAIEGYRLVPKKLIPTLARVLPAVEIVAGAALLFSFSHVFALVLLAALLVTFEVALGYAMRNKLAIGCGCHSGTETSQKSLKKAFGRNLVLIAALAGLGVGYFSTRTGPLASNVLCGLMVLILLVGAWAWDHRPRIAPVLEVGQSLAEPDHAPEMTKTEFRRTRRAFARGGLVVGVGLLATYLGFKDSKSALAIANCGPDFECACSGGTVILSCICKCQCENYPCATCYCPQRQKNYYRCCGGPSRGATCYEETIYSGVFLYCQCCPGMTSDGHICC